jgi:ATP-dependent Clp protease ATP-binding subunit ClpB
MNPEKFTQKSIEALNLSDEISAEYGNPTVEPIHLLLALLKSDGGLIPELLVTLGVDVKSFTQDAEGIRASLPRVSGGSRPQVSGELDKLLRRADKKREEMRDDYLSVEHIMLAMLEEGGKIKELFTKYGISRHKFLETLKDVRGNTRVTNENPEGTYDVLKKYGTDLVVRIAKIVIE